MDGEATRNRNDGMARSRLSYLYLVRLCLFKPFNAGLVRVKIRPTVRDGVGLVVEANNAGLDGAGVLLASFRREVFLRFLLRHAVAGVDWCTKVPRSIWSDVCLCALLTPCFAYNSLVATSTCTVHSVQ